MGKMASIKLIIFLTLILLIPNMGIMAGSPSSSTGNSNYYQFSGQNPGSFPLNESIVNFTMAGSGVGENISVQNENFGSGIAIVTDDYSAPAYLDMFLKSSEYTVIQLGFTWNNTLGAADTDVQFPVYFGKTEVSILSISSGQNSTTISELGDTYHISSELEMNRYYDMKLFFSKLYNQTFYLELYQNGSDSINLPISIPVPVQFNGNLSIMVGGTISEICIYNITDSSESSGILPSTGKANWQSMSIFLPHSYRSLAEGNSAVAIPELNSIYYLDWNVSLVRYNYENRTFSVVGNPAISTSMRIVGVYVKEESIYVLSTDNMDSVLYVFNAGSGIQSQFNLSNIHNAIDLLFLNDSIAAVISDSGGIEWIDPASLNILSNVFSLWGSGLEYNVTGAGFACSSLRVEGVNLTDNSVVTFGITPPAQKVLVISNLSFSNSDGAIYFSGTNTTSSGIFSVFYNILGNGDNSFSMSPGSIQEIGSQYTQPAFYGSKLVVCIDGGYWLLGNSSITSLNLPVLTSPRLWLNLNLTIATEINYSEISLSYENGSTIFSSSNITIHLASHYFLRNNTEIDFDVLSNLPFAVKVAIDNLSFDSTTADVVINSSLIPNGNYDMQVSANNQAGYSFASNASCTVDNNNPRILSTPENGSSIFQGESLWINLTGMTGNVRINISAPDLSIESNSYENLIELPSSESPGEIQIEEGIWDAYGMAFNRSIRFDLLNTSHEDFHSNIYNGEYFKNGNFTISWSKVENVSSYILSVSASGKTSNVLTSGSSVNLSLGNGNYEVGIIPILGDGQFLADYEYNVTVIEFSPGVSVTVSNDSQYSFFGNSMNDTFSASITSNISSRIAAELISPSGTVLMNFSGTNELNVSIIQDAKGLVESGTYSLLYSALSLSGTSCSGSIVFYVNNSIPVIPHTEGEIFYTNMSSVDTGLTSDHSESAFYDLSFDSFSSGYLPLYNGSFSLLQSQGTYNVSLMEVSGSGNTGYYNFTVIYSRQKPGIVMGTASIQIRYTNYTSVSYELNDTVPLSLLRINLGNRTFTIANPEKSGQILLNFSSNGLYNFSVFVEDRCLNYNYSGTFTYNVTYFVTLNSVSIDSNIFGQRGAFYLVMNGSELQNVNASWYVNGHFAGSGFQLSSNLALGQSNITCIIHYDGTSLILSHEVFVVGFYPIYAALTLTIIVASVIYVLSLKKGEEAKNLILRNSGKARSEILKLARRNGIPKMSLRRQLKNLASRHEIRTEYDLSGNLYIFAGEEEN